jgi:tetratricopeptide (TPR) repeat protein
VSRVNRRVARAAAAVACLVAAAFLALVAIDAHAWGTRVPADDLRFRHAALGYHLWERDDLEPFGVARTALGIDDDLLYRRALRAFRVGRPREPLFRQGITTQRIRAQIALEKYFAAAHDDRRKAQAANLIGVLGFAAATQDVGQRVTFLNDAIASFKRAIALDPTNDDAYTNLEFALDQMKEAAEQQAGSGKRVGGSGGAGERDTGHGY